MNKKILLTVLTFGSFHFLGACASKTPRTPQSESDLIADLARFKSEVISNSINNENCHERLNEQIMLLREERLQQGRNADTPEKTQAVLHGAWQLRLELHRRLGKMTQCRTELRTLFYRLRAVEDLAGDHLYMEKPMSPSDINFQKQPVPLKDNLPYHGYLAANGKSSLDVFSIQEGDMLLTRGVSFFSAMLSAITVIPNQVDHFVFVGKDQNGNLRSMESYAQDGGVSHFDLDFALKNENARIVVMRAKDRAMAVSASRQMMRKIEESLKTGKRIGYDYHMDLSQSKTMTCAAVSYWSFKNASEGKFVIPEEASVLDPRMEQILKGAEITATKVLTAQDMEVDSRFELVAEFRDYRILRDGRYRDSILQSIFRWIKEDKYLLRGTFNTKAIDLLIYPTRRTPLLGKAIRKVTGAPEFPPDTPKGFIKILSQLNDLGAILYQRLITEDQKFVLATGWSMTTDQMLSFLENFRKRDLEAYRNTSSSEFHDHFRPKALTKVHRNPGE